MQKKRLESLLKDFGQKYSDILSIDLSDKKEEAVFKWFLASLLFGASIREASAIKTYRCFEKLNVLAPKSILETGWDGLVKILDEGGYTRYDFKTADKLLEVMENLLEKYDGKLTLLYSEASDARNLELRLKKLGKGIGDVTVSIFLRELRDVWKKADPEPTAPMVLAAEKLGIVKEDSTESVSKQLKSFWAKNKVEGRSLVNFETALFRFGKQYRKKGKLFSD
jgi:endonuclease III